MPSSRHQDFHRILLENSPQAILVYDAQHVCQWVSPGFGRIAGRVPSDFLGRKASFLWRDIHWADRGPTRDAWESFWSSPERELPHLPFLFRMRVRSGDYRLVEVQGVNHLADPEVRGLALHFTLVVDRKRAEELLLSERERLLVTLRSIGDGVIATDIDGRITLINSVTETLTGWTQAEAQGRPLPEVFHIVHEATGEPWPNPVDRVLASGRRVERTNHTALISRDGRVSVIEDSAAPIRDSADRIIGAILVFRDVTVSRKTLAELQKMQKLESIGVLAGGIAHDFNNILTAIMGSASLGISQIERSHPVSELLDGIEQAAQRAGHLTQQLLTFSKGGKPLLKETQIVPLVEETAKFLLHGTRTDCRFELASDLGLVMADPGQLGQVVQNLVINASQAMGGAGHLLVRGQTVELSGTGTPPLEDGPYVRLDFVDHGAGISPELQTRIFEPYFTTKPTGSGLGLSVVWSIVKNHGGWVQVESRPGEGTTFSVWLPLARSTKASEVSKAESRGVPLERGTVLVMDDEIGPRRTLVAMLRHLGWASLEAESGEDALALLEAGHRADLALLDLTVKGGLGGREALPLLKACQPGLRVVVTSGYSIDPVMSDYRDFGFQGALRKPFTLADLTRALHEALSDPTP